MSSVVNRSKMNRNIDRLGIARILLVQSLALLALAGAAVWYVNWSSDIAWREFISANQPRVSSPGHQGQSTAPVRPVKGGTACARRV